MTGTSKHGQSLCQYAACVRYIKNQDPGRPQSWAGNEKKEGVSWVDEREVRVEAAQVRTASASAHGITHP